MDSISEKSLALHRELRGKIETVSKRVIHSPEDLALVYTPGVAAVSLAIAKDKKLSKLYTIKSNTVLVATDGSAVLGLGNIGPDSAMPVMEGKCALMHQLGGFNAFPLCLDTQDVEEIIRVVTLVAPTFGAINLEDISAPRCFEIERRLRESLDIPVMHDDQWGTATVVLAGLINAMHLRGINKKDAEVIVNGAGAAGVAIARLLLFYGFRHITVVDTKGAIHKNREDLYTKGAEEKCMLSYETNHEHKEGKLGEVIHGADIFIGVSAPGILSFDMVRSMNDAPIIFALSNPTPEIMPDIAHEAGAYIVATGRSDFPDQVNNCLAFPGIFKGVFRYGIPQITEHLLVRAAEAIAGLVKHPKREKILPASLNRNVAEAVAEAMKER